MSIYLTLSTLQYIEFEKFKISLQTQFHICVLADFTLKLLNIILKGYSKSHIGSMYCRCVWDLSICANSSYRVIVISMTARDRSELNLCRNGPTKWHRNSSWISVCISTDNFSFTNLENGKPYISNYILIKLQNGYLIIISTIIYS